VQLHIVSVGDFTRNAHYDSEDSKLSTTRVFIARSILTNKEAIIAALANHLTFLFVDLSLLVFLFLITCSSLIRYSHRTSN